VTEKHERRHVSHPPERMFDLVADVRSYPDFIPWCEGMRVRRDDTREGSGELVADMLVGFKVFRERFRSRVLLDRPARRIDVDYLDGPFRRLENRWLFEDDGAGGCNIDFAIIFEFKNPFLQATATSVLDRAFLRLSDAFVKRADELYGRGDAPRA